MAYPFSEAPTVEQFIQTACNKYKCELKTLSRPLYGPRGAVAIEYLKKSQKFSEPLPLDREERLGPESLRRLCGQLGIPVQAFGLQLG